MNPLDDVLQSKEFIAAAIQAGAGVVQGLATVVAVWLAYRYGLRHMRRQTEIQLQQDLRKRQADALQVAWSLLQYLSVVENGKNLLRYRQAPKAADAAEAAQSNSARQYFIHLPNAHAFVFDSLPAAFYTSGAGLHWPTGVKEMLFECRNIVYGVLLKEKATLGLDSQAAIAAEPTRPITNPQVPERIEALCQQLNEMLRKEINAIYSKP